MARKWANVSLLLILWGLLLNCSSSPSDSTTEAVEQNTVTSTESNITTLSFSGSSTTIQIDNPSADEDVVVVLYGTESVTQNVELSLPADGQQTPSGSGFAAAHSSHTHQQRGHDLHARLRAYESQLDLTQKIADTGFQASASEGPEVGSEQNFSVMSSLIDFDETTIVNAQLIYQTEYFNYYVDTVALENMNFDLVAELCENFADVIDSMHANFGHESDVNGDGRFDILATPVVNQLGGDTASITTGFWFARDLYDVAGSNRREIFYTAVADPFGEFGFILNSEFAFSNILRSALPHEFQHMINHNERVLQRGALSEDQWLNEALSHIAEDVYSADANDYMQFAGIENPVRVRIYLEQMHQRSFRREVTLAARGGGYLFVRALYDSAEQGEYAELDSGQELLNRLVQSSHKGERNVVQAVFGTDARPEDFGELLGQFALMIYASQNNITLQGLPTLNGIQLDGYQDDNRSTYLHGARMGTLENGSYQNTMHDSATTFIQISGEDLVASHGQIVLNYESGADLSGFLISGVSK